MVSKCTSSLFSLFFVFFFWSLFHSCPLLEKTIMNVALIFNFCCFYEIQAEDAYKYNICCHLLLFLWNQGRRQRRMRLVLVFYFFFLHCKKQWQASPFGVIFYNSRKKHKKHKKLEEDNELFGFSSSSTTQEKKPWCWFFLGCKKQRQAFQLVIIS